MNVHTRRPGRRAAMLGAAAAVALATATAPSASADISPNATSVGDRLMSGQQLTPATKLVSANGQHELGIDPSNSEISVEGSSCPWTWVFRTTKGENATSALAMQGDGNLVYYINGQPQWMSGTFGNPGAFAVLQNDRNLVVYSSAGKPLWNNGTSCTSLEAHRGEGLFEPQQPMLKPGEFLTSPDRAYQLLLQTDGNLVLYKGGRAQWSSGTHGKSNVRLYAQKDGNVVLYSGTRPIWQTKSAVRANNDPNRVFESTFVVQNDGNVVVYQSETDLQRGPIYKNRVRWSSRR